MSTPATRNHITFTADMLDDTKRYGDRLRVAPSEGYPFWIDSAVLPRRHRRACLRIGSQFLLQGKPVRKFLVDGKGCVTLDSFAQLLEAGAKVQPA